MNRSRKLNVTRIALVALFAVFSSTLLSVVGFLIYFFFFTEYKAPNFFPLDDKTATYTIVKSSIAGNNSPEITTSIDSKYKYYLVEYKGRHISSILGNGLDSFTVLVGKSKVALDRLVGKRVKIEGKFGHSSKQCILDTCSDIYGPWIVLNIDEVTLQ